MATQIAFGSILMLVSIGAGGLLLWILEWIYVRNEPWLLRAPHRPKLALVLLVSVLALMTMLTLSVWLWAVAFHLLRVFASFEEAMYFTLVTFTTLGYGDVLMPREWRLLGGLAAANGLFSFGMTTAFLVEALRHVRVRQIEFLKD